MQGNEELRKVLEETNRQLESTIADISQRLKEGHRTLEEAKAKAGKLLSMMRIFLEFGDDNRASFMAFLEREYGIRVERKNFKTVLTNLIKALPENEIQDIATTMENMVLKDAHDRE